MQEKKDFVETNGKQNKHLEHRVLDHSKTPVYEAEMHPGMRLLHRGRRGMLHAVYGRFVIMALMLVLQAGFLVGIFMRFRQYSPYISLVFSVFAVIMAVYMISAPINPSAKLTWLSIMMAMPVFGGLLYAYTKTDWGHRALKKRMAYLMEVSQNFLETDRALEEQIKEENKPLYRLSHYICKGGAFPIYKNTDVNFFSLGEEKFAQMKEELRRAEDFIFMEYFIVDEGIMWGEILEILVEKVKQGVEVRFMYDGTCEFMLLPHNYPAMLQSLGIQCKVFAPIKPMMSTYYNYRDHRKILVIDGHTAFTGGINLADEYINETQKYGHWKDTAIMLKGDAVKSFTLMFLQMWSTTEHKLEFNKYLSYPSKPVEGAKGYVIPFGDVPVDNYKIGKMVYIDILNTAREYVHIMTPYLILDGEMETALRFAANRGIDVKLILPGIPDKKYAFALAHTHYAALLEAGVQIYEYKPGFVHAKEFISDDKKAVVGTVNLDYRSLYHHFECAAYMYDMPVVDEIEKDFQKTLRACQKITKNNLKHDKWNLRIIGKLLKIFAPLM